MKKNVRLLIIPYMVYKNLFDNGKLGGYIMRKCSKCGNILSDDDRFCCACGTMYETEDIVNEAETTVLYSNENDNNVSTVDIGKQQFNGYQQQYQNQQFWDQQLLIEQQKMLNNVVQQQQYMNNKMANSQPYVYVPTPAHSQVTLKNILAIIAAIICGISIFLPFIGDASITTVSEALSYLKHGLYYDSFDGGLKFAIFMLRLMPWIMGALAIVLVISGFTDVLAAVKTVLEMIVLVIFICVLWIVFETADSETISFDDVMGEFQSGFWLMLVGYVLSIISHYTSIKNNNTSIYAPRRVGGYGVSNTNSRSVAAMAQDGYSNITWICPYCGEQNRDSVCRICGSSRY